MVSMADTSANQAEAPQSWSQAPGSESSTGAVGGRYLPATGVVLELGDGLARGKQTGENSMFGSLSGQPGPG